MVTLARPPKRFRVAATADVVALDDFTDIERKVTDAFVSGLRDNYEIEHPSGKIAVTVSHDKAGWCVTICRPREQ